MIKRIGKRTLALENRPYLLGHAAAVGKKEGEGPLGERFDYVAKNDRMGQRSWELAESELQKTAIRLALRKATLPERSLDLILAGDLLNPVSYTHLLLLLTADINDNTTGIHHNQTVAVLDGILHVMRYHQCGEIVACDDLFGDLQHFICGFRIERCGMLVEQQQIRLAQGGHQQGQRLTLTAGQQTNLTGHAVLQSQTERCQLFAVQLAFLVRNAGAEAALLTAAVCQLSLIHI